MRPSVRVPVLSVARTVTDPRVSTAGRRRTSAWRLAIRYAPRARAMVTTAGRDSGMAATARLTASTSMSVTASPRSRPNTMTSAARARVSQTSWTESRPSRCCSGVGRGPAEAMAAAIAPRPLSAPVRTTSPNARPRVRTVPAATSSVALRATGTDSPVIRDSSSSSPAASVSRTSAGTTSPASSRTRSPGTTSAPATCTSRPSRSTVACGAAIRSSAARASAARSSWATPIVVLSTTTARMMPPSGRSPTATTTANAPSRSRIIGSRSWSSTRRAGPRRGARGARLGP